MIGQQRSTVLDVQGISGIIHTSQGWKCLPAFAQSSFAITIDLHDKYK